MIELTKINGVPERWEYGLLATIIKVTDDKWLIFTWGENSQRIEADSFEAARKIIEETCDETKI